MTPVHNRVIELYNLGRRPADIAHDLGVAVATVQYHLGTRESDCGAGERSRPQASAPTREMVAALLARGMSRVEISRRLGVAKSTVSYHARSLGAPVDARCGRRIDWDLVQRCYDDGHSVRECAQRFGFSTSSWHQAVKRGQIRPRPAALPLAEVFAAGTRRNRGHLKRHLLNAGIKLNVCECCGLTGWRGKPISLALHHVNGDRLDNRVENLQFLCPNCHSQTENYAGRNLQVRS